MVIPDWTLLKELDRKTGANFGQYRDMSLVANCVPGRYYSISIKMRIQKPSMGCPRTYL